MSQAFDTIQALRSLRDIDTSTYEYALLAAIISRANIDGVLWCSQSTLANECGMSRQQCNATLRRLTDRGLIRRDRTLITRTNKGVIKAKTVPICVTIPIVNHSDNGRVCANETIVNHSDNGALCVNGVDIDLSTTLTQSNKGKSTKTRDFKMIAELDAEAFIRWRQYLGISDEPCVADVNRMRSHSNQLRQLPKQQQAECVSMGINKGYKTLPVEWFMRDNERKGSDKDGKRGGNEAFNAMLEAIRNDTLADLDDRIKRVCRAVYGDRHTLMRLSTWQIDSKRQQFVSAWSAR